jgi:NitT/TauT family transport system substrate-binding protein
VQFAPFYYADQEGYYRDAGLDVSLQYLGDAELIALVSQGALDAGLGDGTSVIPAVSQGFPLRYAATIYARFPVVVFTKSSSGIRTPADLDGRSLGTPARGGSSWIMLQALLASAGLTPDDLEITLYPAYGQEVGVAQGQVEAATGFRNNEPVKLALAGEELTILAVDDITPLPGPGLVTGESTLASRRDALAGFVAATLRAMAEITADPEEGLDAAIAVVPDLATDPVTQRAILDATIEAWSSPYTSEHGLGAIDPVAWQASVDFMSSLPRSPVATPVTVDQLITRELLPER